MSLTVNTPKQFVSAYEKHGSIKAVAREAGVSYGKIHGLYEQAVAEGMMDSLPRGHKTREHLTKVIKGSLKVKKKPKPQGRRKAMVAVPLPRKAKGVTRFIFSCAQNDTKLHEGLWRNLLALSDHYGASIHIAKFSYIKRGLGARGDKHKWARKEDFQSVQTMTWDDRIKPYVLDERREVAPGLVWCGEINILPTAARPLSGLEVYTGRKSGIFPHVKIALDSIACPKNDPVKFNYTTGTVTMRNYIWRKEGFKGEFHHCYGALLVEVNEDGDWWCRQLNADSEGTLYDLDVCVRNGEVTTGNRVEAITWGDIHRKQLDPDVERIAWGKGGVLDTLRPKRQFCHDILDFHARSHHDLDDPHQQFLRYVRGEDNVRAEVSETAKFALSIRRDYTETVIVNSNHDRHLLRWLKDKRALHDPMNVEFWTAMNARVWSAVREEGDFPIILREAFLEALGLPKEPHGIRFLAQDESMVICPNAGGGIECGQHGDDGPNGSRGSTMGYARVGRKMNKGHDHTARIVDGIYSAGTCRKLVVPGDYAHGFSSWSHSHIVTYPNGKRCIITFWHGLPWAKR